MKLLRRIYLFIGLLAVFLFPHDIKAQDSTQTIYDLSLFELKNIKVTSASFGNDDVIEAPSNIIVITREMLEARGYLSLVEICEDLPGFDFLMYEDGGGEYPTYSKNRGVGTIGNSGVLIMIDGVIQNEISFTWSLLWTFENIFSDLDRIEIIEGPGSSLYGAQAFSGVINFVTKNSGSGINAKTYFGSFFTMGTDFNISQELKKDKFFSFAFRRHQSKGDNGDRYDPGNYFHNLSYPTILTANYDGNGDFITDQPNPLGGQSIPSGFNTWNKNQSFRLKFKTKNSELSAFYYQSKSGSSSYLTSHQYDLRGDEYQNGRSGFHIRFNNNAEFSQKVSLNSDIIARNTTILPITGFRYTYQFPELTKSYQAYSYQYSIEERLKIKLNEKHEFFSGMKGMYSLKAKRAISLGELPSSSREVASSWEIAKSGGGLGVAESFPAIPVKELAFYGLLNSNLFKTFSSSIGLRYDLSSEFGSSLNPRLSMVFSPMEDLGVKLMYGTSFRQPSTYELFDEFRGNEELHPEKIRTFEFEFSNNNIEEILDFKLNIFNSTLREFITTVPMNNLAGEQFSNRGEFYFTGMSFGANLEIAENIHFYSNYMWLTGKESKDGQWQQIDHTATHKLNGGLNFSFLDNKISFNPRFNWVGIRKAPETNTWLQTYENGYAPAYLKVNFTTHYAINEKVKLQLIVKNLFNEQYYGVGRGSGSVFIDDYSPDNFMANNFLPAYHPQPGRTIMLSANFSLQ